MPGYYKEDPVERCSASNVWINPFWEDDVNEVVRAHGRRPRDLRLRLAAHRGHAASRSTTCGDVAQFDDAAKRKILRDNTLELNELRPA